jgi:hypothetical protein
VVSKLVLNLEFLNRVMASEHFQCSECGKVFGSEQTLRDHAKIEHGSRSIVDLSQNEVKTGDILKRVKPYFNMSFLLGFLTGMLVAAAAFYGYVYLDSGNSDATVPVTVVTCDNCSWDRFKGATSRMFNADYREIDYQSEQAEEMIQKYDINYIPAFIFSKEIEEADNFTRIRNVLIEFDDAYVIPDQGIQTARYFSKGITLE